MSEPRLIDLYAQESGDAFDRVVDLLLGTEDPACPPATRAERLHHALRALHGAKGGALVVDGLAPVGALIHALEARLGVVSPDAPTPADVLDAALRAVDVCRALVAAAVSGGRARVDVDGALAALGAAPPAPASTPDTPASDAPADEVATELTTTPSADTIRVGLADLDALLRTLAELSACGAALTRRLDDVEALALSAREASPGGAADEATARHREAIERLGRALRGDAHRLTRVARDARGSATRMRLQPFSSAFEPLRRAARDVAHRTSKAARLVAEGGDVLVDKRALDALRAPLLHLVRNAVDHGLEEPAARARAGKAPEGRVRVAARRQGDRVVLVVEDDGRGLDPAALRARAAALGIASGPEVPLVQLLGHAGLSTREEADEVSGRGLGLGAVRAAVEQLGGRLEVDTAPGRGTSFTLGLPLQVAARRGLLVSAGGRSAYLPAGDVLRLVRREGDVLVVDGRRALPLDRGAPVPIVRLADVLGAPADDPERATYVVLSTAAGRCAVQVERVEAQEELVLQPLRHPLVRLRHVEGLVVRDDGDVVPLLDPRRFLGLATSEAPRGQGRAARKAPPRILVVDDSITTRTLERNVLEGAGMEVQLASDGQEALDLVTSGREFDLVVSDIEMPRLDGIGLVGALRRTHPRARLPIVLVTSVEEDAVRARGMEAGADALIVKQRFDNEHLLAVVRTLLGRRAEAEPAA